MSSNPTKSEATNAETTKNPKEGSDWLGGPQNGSETPGNGGNGGNGAVTQNGSEAYFIPRHRNETPGESAGRVGTGNIAGNVESDYTKHRFNETPGEASKQAPDSQALVDDLDGTSSNDEWTGRGKKA